MMVNSSCLKGVVYGFLWYFSIWTGFLYFCCPLLLFVIFLPKYFSPLMGTIFSIWEMYPVALMNLIFGTTIYICGDKIDTNECSIVLLNHRTRVDWNFLWAAMYYGSNPRTHRLKMVLKAPLRHTPSLGWVMQVCGFLYIHRKWEQDEIIIKNHLQYYKSIGHMFQILIFPEGTNLSKEMLEKSNSFAVENNLEKYEHVLHPRTRGFTLLTNIMKQNKQLDAIYDLTLAYPDSLPQTEQDVLRGVFPKGVHFYIKRYSVSEIPSEETQLNLWLHKRWSEKEKILKDFYLNKKFSYPYNYTCVPDNSIHLAFLFWTLLIVIMFISFISSSFFFCYTIVCSMLFVTLSFISDGIQNIEVSMNNFMQNLGKLR